MIPSKQKLRRQVVAGKLSQPVFAVVLAGLAAAVHPDHASARKYALKPALPTTVAMGYIVTAEAGGDDVVKTASWPNAEGLPNVDNDLKDSPFLRSPRNTAVSGSHIRLDWSSVREGQGTSYYVSSDSSNPRKITPRAAHYRLRICLGSPRGKILWEGKTRGTHITVNAPKAHLEPGRRYFWQVMAVSRNNLLVHTGSSFFTVLLSAQAAEAEKIGTAFRFPKSRKRIRRSAVPSLTKCFAALARYEQLGMHDQMIELARNYGKIYPRRVELLQVQGEIYLRKGIPGRAYPLLHDAASLDSNNWQAWVGLMYASSEEETEDDYSRFRRILETASRKQPRDFQLRSAAAASYNLGGPVGSEDVPDIRAKAARHLRAAIRLQPDNAMVHLSLGRILFSGTDYDGGVASDSAPTLDFELKNRSHGKRIPRQPLKQFSTFLRLFCDQIETRYYWMDNAEMTELIEEVAPALIYYNYDLSEVERSMGVLERVWLNDYARRYLRYQLAKCYFHRNQYTRAIDTMKEVIAIDKKQARKPRDEAWELPTHYDQHDLIMLYISAGRPQQALALSWPALRGNMRVDKAVVGHNYYAIGRAYLELHRYQSALKYLQQAIIWQRKFEMDDETWSATHRQLSRAYKALGQKKKAREAWNEAVAYGL